MRQLTNDEIGELAAAQAFAECMLKIVWAVERADELIARAMGRACH